MNNPSLLDVFINWFPMILFVGVMIVLMRNMRSPQNPTFMLQTEQVEALRKQNELLERIARALEGKSPPMFGSR